jgi:hypothetical protein
MQNSFKETPINNLKIENRNHIISKLETGDLVRVSTSGLGIISHYGIIEKKGDELYIIHNHPDSINSKGGNVTRELLEKWIKCRDIISVEKTDIKPSEIKDLYEYLKGYKYNFMNFNCEHFVNFAKGSEYRSSQVFKWTTAVAIGAVIYYLIKNKKI